MPKNPGEIWRRIWYFLNRSRFERELREEMDAHRAEAAASLLDVEVQPA